MAHITIMNQHHLTRVNFTKVAGNRGVQIESHKQPIANKQQSVVFCRKKGFCDASCICTGLSYRNL